MNNAPKELTRPPEGYEWTGEFRAAKSGEQWAWWYLNRWELTSGETHPENRRPILRKVKPPTVMVELPRELVEEQAKGAMPCSVGATCSKGHPIANACCAALEAENEHS